MLFTKEYEQNRGVFDKPSTVLALITMFMRSTEILKELFLDIVRVGGYIDMSVSHPKFLTCNARPFPGVFKLPASVITSPVWRIEQFTTEFITRILQYPDILSTRDRLIQCRKNLDKAWKALDYSAIDDAAWLHDYFVDRFSTLIYARENECCKASLDAWSKKYSEY